MLAERHELGAKYKSITVQNLTVRDAPEIFFPGGLEAWIDSFSGVMLFDRVPQKIVELFEVAKESMIYGWFYYPLLTVGAEQCYRIVESAVRIKCEEIGIETRKLAPNGDQRPVSFSRLQKALFSKKILDERELDRWNALRDLRNMASHPDSQSIMTPGMAMDILHISAAQVNSLFR